MKRIVTWMLLVAAIVQVRSKCPKECRCDVVDGRKGVICDKGGMTKIPVIDMDEDISILIITSPADNLNALTLGRIFGNFKVLEEVSITYSNIPAIGDSSFWPGDRLTTLDLSHNNITILRESHFNGLAELVTLDLSDNNLAASPSAPFRLLRKLKNLSLARNKFTNLVPRFFFELSHLESLDLSGNNLDGFDPDNLMDLAPLKRLNFSNCHISYLHPQSYQHLRNLEEFDLRYNLLTRFAPDEFRHLKHLSVLYLDYNLLTTIEDGTFNNHSLKQLTISHNIITDLQSCAFCTVSIAHLDLSHNRISFLHQGVLVPLGEALISLNLSYNHISPESLSKELYNLPNLLQLSLAGCEIVRLPTNMFSQNQWLQEIDLSHNLLFNLSDTDIDSFSNLTILDLSSNKIRALNTTLLTSFEAIKYVYLDANPWSCTECDLTDVLMWINTSAVYRRSCETKGRCASCSTPTELFDKRLESLKEEELGSCIVPFTQSRVGLLVNPQLGVIIAVSALALLLIIIIAILLYRRHGAVYYTHEEEISEDGDKTSLTDSSGGFGDDKKPVFITTIERMDDRLEEKPTNKNTIG